MAQSLSDIMLGLMSKESMKGLIYLAQMDLDKSDKKAT